jgi:hypothetical protein
MEGNNFVMDTIVDGLLFLGHRTHKAVMMHVIECSTIVVENPFIEQGPSLQSFTKIAVGVEYDDGGIRRINNYISGSCLVLGKNDVISEAQPLKVLVARNLSF